MAEPSLEQRVAHLEDLVGHQQFELERRVETIVQQDRELARLRAVLCGMAAVCGTARLPDPTAMGGFPFHASTADS